MFFLGGELRGGSNMGLPAGGFFFGFPLSPLVDPDREPVLCHRSWLRGGPLAPRAPGVEIMLLQTQ